MTFGAKRKAQRQPSFVSCYGDAISPSHWISPKALVLPGEVNPAKTTPDGIDQHSLFSTATGWSGARDPQGSQGPTNNPGTDHAALMSLATSPEKKKFLRTILAHSASPRTSSPPTGAAGTPRGLTQPSSPEPQPPAHGGTGGWEPPGFSCPVLFAGNRSDLPMGAAR